MLHKEGGFSPFELIGGAFILAIGFTIFFVVADWMADIKRERAKARNPHLFQQKDIVEVENGEEFGSFIITFKL